MKWAFFVGLFHTTGSLEEGGQQVQGLSMKTDEALVSAPSPPCECLKEQYKVGQKHRRKRKLAQLTPLNFPLCFINQIRVTQLPLATEEAEDEDVVSQAMMKMETEQKIQNVSAQAIDTSVTWRLSEQVPTGRGPAPRVWDAVGNSGKK